MRTRETVSTEQSTESATDHYVEALERFRGDVRMMEQVLATMIERGEPRSATHLEIIPVSYTHLTLPTNREV